MPAVGLRERKKADTRSAIARAALELAVERGPDAVTVDDIATGAGVSPRTVFNYFATKEDAILGFDPARSREIGRMVLERPPRESPLAALQMAFLEIGTENPEAAAMSRARARLVQDNPHLHPRYVAGYSGLEHALVEAIAERTGVDPRASVYPRLLVSTAIAAFRVASESVHAGGTSLADALGETFAMLGSGLRAPR
jgi:AcrR family transcriptional regulator